MRISSLLVICTALGLAVIGESTRKRDEKSARRKLRTPCVRGWRSTEGGNRSPCCGRPCLSLQALGRLSPAPLPLATSPSCPRIFSFSLSPSAPFPLVPYIQVLFSLFWLSPPFLCPRPPPLPCRPSLRSPSPTSAGMKRMECSVLRK